MRIWNAVCTRGGSRRSSPQEGIASVDVPHVHARASAMTMHLSNSQSVCAVHAGVADEQGLRGDGQPHHCGGAAGRLSPAARGSMICCNAAAVRVDVVR